MRQNVTLSADDELIRKAREKALREQRTLNAAFREWLERYVGQADAVQRYRQLMQRLKHVRPGREFTREELNER